MSPLRLGSCALLAALSLSLAACSRTSGSAPPNATALSPATRAEGSGPTATAAPLGCARTPARCDMAEASPPAQPEGY